MLENMRRQGASIFIYLIFGLLVAIFVININPGQKGGGRDAGCGTTSNVVVDVDGARANETGWHVAYGSEYTSYVARQYAMSSRTESGEGRWREYVALDTLIRRELLASAAAEHGIRVNGDMLDEEIKKGYFFLHAPPALQPAQDYPMEPTGRVQLGSQIFDFHHSEFCTKSPTPEGCNEQCNPQMPFTCKQGFTCVAGEEEGQGTCDKECTPKGNECGADERCVMGRCSTWSVAKWKRFASNSHDNISLNAFREEQMRSLQATLMAEYLVNAVRVSRDEALAGFLYEGNTVGYDVVSFNPKDYERIIRLTDTDVQRFLTTHEEDVKKKWKELEVTYKKTKPALKLRKLFIAKAADAPKPDGAKPDDKKPDDKKPDGAKPDAPKPDDKKTDAAKPDDKNAAGAKVADAKTADAKTADAKKPDDKKPADAKTADAKKPDDKKPADAKKEPAVGAKKPDGLPIEEARAKLEAARAQIAAGKKKFAEAVKELSTDDNARANGGDMGWKQIESPELGEAAINDAIKALKPGEMTPVVVGERGAYLVMAEDKREGDLTYDQVKLEIAADLAKVEWSKEKAKRDALAALETAQKTGKRLSDLFEKEDLGIPVDQRSIDRAIKNRFPKSGALEVETIDIPVAWKADKDGSSSGSATGTPAVPAAGSAPVPAAGSAPAPATGSAAGSGSAAPVAPAAPAAPAAPVAITPSKDDLPAFGEYKPRLVSETPTPRQEYLPGLGKDLTKVVFDEMSAGSLAKRVYEVDNTYVVFQVTTKGQPKVEDFEKDADKQIALLRLKRSHVVVEEFLKARCEALAKENKIKALQHVRDQDSEGKPIESYRPCMTAPFWLLRFR